MIGIALEKPGQFIAIDGPPPAPAPGDALVRVHRIGICGTDLHAFAGRQPFFSYPRILGHELGVAASMAGTFDLPAQGAVLSSSACFKVISISTTRTFTAVN